MELAALMRTIEEQRIAFVDFQAVDLIGRLRHVTVPARRFTSALVASGVACDGSNYGYAHVEGSDMLMVPDLDTAVIHTQPDGNYLALLCDLRLPHGGEFTGDPRSVARRAAQYVMDSGTADQIMMSPEFEFYVFASPAPPAAETAPPPYSFYHVAPPVDTSFALRNEMCRRLEEIGIKVKYHHHEVGQAGQLEIEVEFAPLPRIADIAVVVKAVIRQTAADHGLTATFMPKPIPNAPGNGFHVHQYLTQGGTSLFAGDGDLSELALRYIGGIITHGPSLMAFTNPSTNSYRRLVPGYEAPVVFAFGEGNRSAAIRVPAYAAPAQRRIEVRTVDATCNPYLAFAALVMAGMDGVNRGLNAKQLGFGPYNRNLYAENDDLPHAPADLGAALAALAADHDYLLVGDVFSESLIEHWIAVKQDEIAAVHRRPHPYEFALYGDL